MFIVELSSECWFLPFLLTSMQALGMKLLLKYDNPRENVAVSTDDVYKSAAAVLLVSKELGGKIIQPPGPIPVINAKMTSFIDPDDWKIVLIDNEDFLKQLQKKE
ncbi:Lactoylglutathione lyase [Vitis vinifera]|uniref:Lactoylglutathione lyase n=1 Tax=Vitis vinifera TaxID=29760 RepID=A0A438DXJ1_VITVI|nr:Lactoylglutathione lyase [Vitis vinifera]